MTSPIVPHSHVTVNPFTPSPRLRSEGGSSSAAPQGRGGALPPAATEGAPNRVIRGSVVVSPSRVAAVGLDRLTLSYRMHAPLPADLVLAFTEYRDSARCQRVPGVPLSIAGEEWLVCPRGRQGYGFHVRRGDVHIFFSESFRADDYAHVLVEVGSVSCWSPGYTVVRDQILHFFINAGIDVDVSSEKVSRADITADFFADIKGLEHEFARDRIISRATSRGHYDDGLEYTGFSVASRPVHITVYDKVKELNRQTPEKIDTFAQVWGVKPEDIYESRISITRVEFRVYRKHIRERHGVDTLDDLMAKLQQIWVYLTYKWIRIADKTVDRVNKNQAHAPVSPFWRRVQSAFSAKVQSQDREMQSSPPSLQQQDQEEEDPRHPAVRRRDAVLARAVAMLCGAAADGDAVAETTVPAATGMLCSVAARTADIAGYSVDALRDEAIHLFLRAFSRRQDKLRALVARAWAAARAPYSLHGPVHSMDFALAMA